MLMVSWRPAGDDQLSLSGCSSPTQWARRSCATSGLGGLGSSEDSVRPSHEAPASIRVRTIATQSGPGLCLGRSPLPTAAQSRGGAVPGGVVGLDVGAAVQQEPDGLGAAG